MAKTTIEVTARKAFGLGGSEYLPGRVKVPTDAVEKLVAKGFIEAPEPSAEAKAEEEGQTADAVRVVNEVLRPLADVLEPLALPSEAPVDVAKRLIQERDTRGNRAATFEEENERLKQQLSKASTFVDDLSKATNSAVSQGVLNAGFTNLEKLRAATDEQLKAVEGLGDAMLAKVRELTK